MVYSHVMHAVVSVTVGVRRGTVGACTGIVGMCIVTGGVRIQDPSCTAEFKQTALELSSSFTQNAADLNMIVYWQMDMERAGMNDIIQVGLCVSK